MCLIVDANVAPLVFAPPPRGEFLPAHRALMAGKAAAVRGGTRLNQEYNRLGRLRRVLIEFDRRGALRAVSDGEVDETEACLKRAGECRSDDQHIIALARVSGARLLCSHDADLHADFTNPALLSPRGSVYQSRSHRPLLARVCGRCPRCRRKAGG
jgi:hypothetical protein